MKLKLLLSNFEIDGAVYSCEYEIYVYIWRVETKSDRTSTRTNTAADRRALAAVADRSTSQAGASGGNGEQQ